MFYVTWILLSVLFSAFSGVIAENKNRNSLVWALTGFLLGPFGLLVAVLPKLKSKKEMDLESRTAACKTCGENIIFNAKVCKHCNIKYPYMSEPERSHIEAIEKIYVNITTDISEVTEKLNTEGPKCLINDGFWIESHVKKVIRDHVTS